MSNQKVTYKVTKNLLESGHPCKIFFLGDSITSAEWIHPNWREIVEYVLKEHFNSFFSNYKISEWQIRCFNAGFDGSNTRDITQLISNYVLPHKPDILLYQLGSNDNYAAISDTEYADNIGKTLTQLEKEKVLILLMSDLPSGYPEHNKAYQPRRKILKNIVSEKELPYLDLYDSFEEAEISGFFSLISEGNEDAHIKKGDVDMIHPNIIGNAFIAQAILQTFFGISFNADRYISEVKNTTIFYPGL